MQQESRPWQGNSFQVVSKLSALCATPSFVIGCTRVRHWTLFDPHKSGPDLHPYYCVRLTLTLPSHLDLRFATVSPRNGYDLQRTAADASEYNIYKTKFIYFRYSPKKSNSSAEK
jgi:hypothetical protein